MAETPLKCIVCDFQPESALPDDIEGQNQPYKATSFTTYGHYGSTVIDTMGEYFIEINVCDECLKKNKHKVLRGHNRRAKVVTEYEPWDPHAE